MRLKRWESALVDWVNAKDLAGSSYRRVKTVCQIEKIVPSVHAVIFE